MCRINEVGVSLSAAVTVGGMSMSAAGTMVMSSSAPSPPGVSRGGTVSHYRPYTALHYWLVTTLMPVSLKLMRLYMVVVLLLEK